MFIPVDIPSDNLAAVFRVLLTSLKLLQDAVEEIKQVGGGTCTLSGAGPSSLNHVPARATAWQVEMKRQGMLVYFATAAGALTKQCVCG